MALASILIAFAALVVAILSAWYALREARIGNALPRALEFLGQYRQSEARADRRFVVQELAKWDAQLGVSQLPDEVQERVVRVSHYLDHLGVLVDRGLVDAKLVAGFMGDSIIRLWKTLSPYINAERQRRRGEDYQRYFENLAERMREIQPAEARARMKRFGG